MPLTCSCDFDYEPEPGQTAIDWYTGKEIDFETLSTSKRKRCISCKKLINIGDECIKFRMLRHPHNEIEARIHGIDWDCFEEPKIKIAPVYQCENCGEIWLNLQEVGFECLSPFEDMNQSLKDYQIEYAPPKLTLK